MPTQEFGTHGILAWYIPFELPIPVSVVFDTQNTVSLSIPILAMTFSGDSSISFDKDDFMNMQSSIDWDAEKPDRSESKGYYRWWICYTFQGTGYMRQNLVWGTGVGKPGKFAVLIFASFVIRRLRVWNVEMCADFCGVDTPSCVKVQVKRVFVGK